MMGGASDVNHMAECEVAGEILTLEWEENTHSFTVSLIKDVIIVGHVPQEFLRVFWHLDIEGLDYHL